jgi:hypothetical protein
LSPDLFNAARDLLSSEDGEEISSERIATRGIDALEKLSTHLARVVGTHGSRTVFRRAIALTAAKFPWLPHAPTDAGDRDRENPFPALGKAMSAQSPDLAIEAFVLVLSTYIGLLGRLTGDELAWRLLHEVWPTIFPQQKKEPQ